MNTSMKTSFVKENRMHQLQPSSLSLKMTRAVVRHPWMTMALLLIITVQLLLGVTNPYQHVVVEAVPDHLPIAWLKDVQRAGDPGKVDHVRNRKESDVGHD